MKKKPKNLAKNKKFLNFPKKSLKKLRQFSKSWEENWKIFANKFLNLLHFLSKNSLKTCSLNPKSVNPSRKPLDQNKKPLGTKSKPLKKSLKKN